MPSNSKYGKTQSMSLMDSMRHPVRHSWRPDEPPSVIDADTVYIDFETTGLRWWDNDIPIGLAVAWGSKETGYNSRYLPWGHAGGNLSEDAVRRWAKTVLAGKRLVGSKIQFDCHMGFKWGVDFEAMGCLLGDVGLQAALLDDHRRRFGLEYISQEHLGRGKRQMPFIKDMRHTHAGEVHEYAEDDVLLCLWLEEKFFPMLEEQELHEVRELEEEVIYSTCEMERNGVYLDVEKLELWSNQIQHIIQKLLWELTREVGFKVEPGDRDCLSRIFKKLGITNPYRTAVKDEESFTDAVLERFDHPTIMKLRLVREYISLDNKFIKNYKAKVDRNGLLRYALHQVATDDGGTVSGRYSSSGLNRTEGVNIQQVAKPSKQKITLKKLEKSGLLKIYPWLKEFIVRDLFIPEPGQVWGKADAKQIEYRLFGHFSEAPKVLAAYAKDPETDFHNFVMTMIQATKPDITRDRTKDLNFAKIYGAGLKKIAVMLGYRSPTEPMTSDVGVAEVKPFVEAYDAEFPEAKKLLNKASKLAEARGYVKTIMGRRARFIRGEFSHAALNRVIQGSAADIQKQKSVELYRTRKQTGIKLRYCVHDEFDFDAPNKEAVEHVKQILDKQSFDLKVPILWDVNYGVNWGACK